MQFNWQHWTREGTCCILNDSCSQHLSDHALILIFFNLAVMIRSHTIISVTPLGVFLIWFFITYRKQRSHTNLVTTCFKDNEGLLTSAGWKPHLLVEHLCELLTWRVLCKYEGASRSMLMACSSPLPSSWFSSTIILPPSFCNVLSVVLRDILVIPRTESPWSLTVTPPTWNSVFCYFQLVVTGSSFPANVHLLSHFYLLKLQLYPLALSKPRTALPLPSDTSNHNAGPSGFLIASQYLGVWHYDSLPGSIITRSSHSPPSSWYLGG